MTTKRSVPALLLLAASACAPEPQRRESMRASAAPSMAPLPVAPLASPGQVVLREERQPGKATIRASCLVGERLLGGGCRGFAELRTSAPVAANGGLDGAAWECDAIGVIVDEVQTAYAFCAGNALVGSASPAAAPTP